MAKLENAFTAAEHKDEFATIPPGKYVLAVTKTEMKATKAGDGQYLLMEMDVQDGQYQGRKLFERLNLVSTNATAKKIAESTLANICRAVGKVAIQDSDELLGLPFVGEVIVEESSDPKYSAQNRVKKYMAKDGSTPVAATPDAGPWGRN